MVIHEEMSKVIDAFVTEILQFAKKTAVESLRSIFAIQDINSDLSFAYIPTVLKVESLEATMNVLSYSINHIKFWKDIPKLPAYQALIKINGKSYCRLHWHDELEAVA